MRFEARELKDYVVHVPPAELQEGVTYFWVYFEGDDMLVPWLEPVVYVGRDLDPEQDKGFYFQNVSSYLRGVRFSSFHTDDPAEAATEDKDAREAKEAKEAKEAVEAAEVNGERSQEDEEQTYFHIFPESQEPSVCTFDEALNVLLQCSVRRAAKGLA